VQLAAQPRSDVHRPALIAAGAGAATIALAAAVAQPAALPLLLGANAALLAYALRGWWHQWQNLTTVIVLVILLIPIGRYTLPGNLPFSLEPYRLLVAVVAALWIAALLAEPSMQWRKAGLFGPVALLSIGILLSIGTNTGRIQELNVGSDVIKQVTMFGSFIVVMLLVCSVLQTRAQLDAVIKALVGGGAIVGLFATVEYHTGFNIFDQLWRVIPVLSFTGPLEGLEARGGGSRIYGSAAHPIALSAALVMLLPLGIYLGQRFRGRVWWVCTALIGTAAFATVARTGSTMLLTVLIVFLILKPRQVLKLWPWFLPFLVVVHFVAPGALGGLKNAFFPAGGLIAEQKGNYSYNSSNRLADAGPALDEWWQRPYAGYGFGTRITNASSGRVNAKILDNQWLGVLLEIGAIGTFALLWLFIRSIRRLGGAARRDQTPHGWLPTALAASLAAFIVGMFTFDAFGFAQVTFLAFMMVGLGVVACRLSSPDPETQP
jgi:hypothetical protein